MKHLEARISCRVVVFSVLVFWTSHVAAAELTKVTFGYSSIGPMMHGLWMAKEIGAFERHGLEAELIFIVSGPVVSYFHVPKATPLSGELERKATGITQKLVTASSEIQKWLDSFVVQVAPLLSSISGL